MLSIKSECLDRLLILGDRHLRYAIDESVEHYHTERNHQGLANRLISSQAAKSSSADGPVYSRQRLGGMLNFYYQRAA